MSLHTTISFALVNIPVTVEGAVKGATTKETPTKLLHDACNTPISTVKVCRHCDIELEPDWIVKGVKVKGQWRPVELDNAPVVAKNKVIQLVKFTKREFAEIRFKANYWLLPRELERQYAILGDAMGQAGVTGFGFAALWGSPPKEHPVLVESHGGILMLRLLHHNEDIVDPSSHGLTVESLHVPTSDEVNEACVLLDRYTGEVQPEELTTEARQWREQQIQQQAGVETVGAPEFELGEEPTVDIMEAIRLSIDLADKQKAKVK